MQNLITGASSKFFCMSERYEMIIMRGEGERYAVFKSTKTAQQATNAKWRAEERAGSGEVLILLAPKGSDICLGMLRPRQSRGRGSELTFEAS